GPINGSRDLVKTKFPKIQFKFSLLPLSNGYLSLSLCCSSLFLSLKHSKLSLLVHKFSSYLASNTKNFVMPRNQILRENHEIVSASPNPKSRPTTQSPSSRKLKSNKENAPPTPASDTNSMGSSSAAKKSSLPPRPPLKRKLSVEPVASENCGAAANSLDSGVKIDIFELVGAPLVENCLAGFNSSVFAYGQTGSGKTYTIWGASNALLEEEHQGLAPRVFCRLFERIAEEQTRQADRQLVYMCRCSFLEIYNEQITDLLDPSQKNLQIREDAKMGVYVENLREECVTSMKDVSQLLIKGLSNRKTSATCVNAESSRSHSVFTCVVESRGKSATDGLSRLKMSRINFVDLAGSERQKQTGAAGERLKEAGNINRSLSQLGYVSPPTSLNNVIVNDSLCLYIWELKCS
ncbi:phragmoplast-associated kinesin-related protein, partial [Striga asiatica]